MKNKLLLLTLFSAIALLLSPISYVTARNIQSKSITDTTKLKNTNIEQKRADTLNAKAPTFRNGGVKEFKEWVGKNTKYPESAYKERASGRIVVQMTLGTDGRIGEVVLLEGIHHALNQEVINTVKRSPKWSPAMQNGVPVSVKLNFAVIFNINND